MAIQVTIMSIDFDSYEEPVTKVFNKNEITVGRKPGNDLVLDKPEVSSYHAKLIAKPNGQSSGKLFVVDLGSSNGTLLERDTLKPDVEIPIHSNQRLIIGSFLIKPKVIGEVAEVPASAPVVEALPETPIVSGHSFTEISVMRSSKVQSTPVEEREEPKSLERPPSLAARVLSGRTPFLKRPAQEVRVSTRPAAEPTQPVSAPEPEPLAASLPEKTPVSEPSIAHHETHEMSVMPPVVSLTVSGDETVDLHFEASQLFTLSAFVGNKGMPLAGVRVDAGSLGRFETDSNGRMSAPEIVEGTAYSITLFKEGYLFEPAVLSGVVNADTDLTIHSVKLFRVSGTVRHRGQGLGDVLIDGGQLGTCNTNSDGSFAFQNIREGTSYEFHAERDKYAFESINASGMLEGDTTIDFSATKLISVAGQVVHKGRPLAGVEIECINLGKTTTDSEGRYIFENIPEGTQCTFAASKPGFRFTQGTKTH